MTKTYSNLEEELPELRHLKDLMPPHDHSNVRIYHARRKYLDIKIASLIGQLSPYTKPPLKMSVDKCYDALVEVLRDSGVVGIVEMDGEKLYITPPETEFTFTGLPTPCVAAIGYPTTQTVVSYKSTEFIGNPLSYELEYETVKVLTVDGV